MALADQVTPDQMVYAGSEAEKKVAKVRERMNDEKGLDSAVETFLGELNAPVDVQFGEQKGKSRWEMLKILLGRLTKPLPQNGSQERDALERNYLRSIAEKEDVVIGKGARAVEKVKGIRGLSHEGRVELVRKIMNRLGLYLSDLKPQEIVD